MELALTAVLDAILEKAHQEETRGRSPEHLGRPTQEWDHSKNVGLNSGVMLDPRG